MARPDLLRAPILGSFLRWRHARSVLQGLCLALAALLILDGLFGPQLAPRNLAGVLPWVHWRGFVVLALLVAGNLFCMACPFMLPRRLAKQFLPADRDWPAALRTKWLAVGLLLLFFWAYEAFSLWASPWLTAWVAIAYFLLAFVIDGFFRGASFCKHVCPIGQFHFVNSVVSPLEVRVRDAAVCESCTTKDCIRGRYAPGFGREGLEEGWDGGTPGPGGRTGAASGRAFGKEGLVQSGCELALFQPGKVGNLDCTFCLECIHACPHENVGIVLRPPLEELRDDPVRAGVGRLTTRPDFAALALLLVFAAYVNALGMVEPVFRIQGALAGLVPAVSEATILLLYFLLGLVLLPFLVVGATAWASGALAGSSDPIRERAVRFAWALVPVGFGMWAAHYLFHLLVGGLTIVPVAHEYLAQVGVLSSGAPRWGMGAMVPESWLFPVEFLLLMGGLVGTMVAAYRVALREEGSRRKAGRAWLPWAVLATLLTVAGIWILMQPMEMRGTFQVL